MYSFKLLCLALCVVSASAVEFQCPTVKCGAPDSGCHYEPNNQLNANGCKKHPCGLKVCTAPSCPTDCKSWFDGCNTCSCNNGRVSMCTAKACLVNQRPKCLDVVPCQRDGSSYCKAPTQWDTDVCKCTSECDDNSDIPDVCIDKPVDIAFVLDSSGSIGSNWAPLVTAVANIITGLKIGPNDIQVAAHTFSSASHGNPGFGLDEYTGWTNVKHAISGFTHLKGSTYIGQAVTHTVDAELVASEGLRNTGNAPAMIIVTDGNPFPSSQGPVAIAAANAAKAKGIKVFAIGVGGYNGSNLNAMASGTDYVYKLQGFDVDAFKKKLLTTICTDATTTAQQYAANFAAASNPNLLPRQVVDAVVVNPFNPQASKEVDGGSNGWHTCTCADGSTYECKSKFGDGKQCCSRSEPALCGGDDKIAKGLGKDEIDLNGPTVQAKEDGGPNGWHTCTCADGSTYDCKSKFGDGKQCCSRSKPAICGGEDKTKALAAKAAQAANNINVDIKAPECPQPPPDCRRMTEYLTGHICGHGRVCVVQPANPPQDPCPYESCMSGAPDNFYNT